MDLKRQSEIWLWRPEGTGSDESTESASSDDAFQVETHLQAVVYGSQFRIKCPICSKPPKPFSAAEMRRPAVSTGRYGMFVAELLGIRDNPGPIGWRACTVVMRLRCPDCSCRGIVEISCSMESQPAR